MKNFWKKLNKPIFALAPMEEVTDVAFREMFARHSRSADQKSANRQTNPFVMYTEFVNVDGLTHPDGYKRLSLDLKFTEIQRPMVAQIWGNNPDKFYEAAKICASLGFDGIDINMGCPQDKEIGQGTCAALIRQPELAGKIIEATIKGAGELPVSVKTRLGYSKIEEMEGWVSHLLSFGISALALHARTKQEKSKVPAHWDRIADAVKLRNQLKSKVIILGNGDIKSRQEGLDRIAQTGCDGVMVGRGAFGNPWFFREDNYQPTIKEKLQVMLEHAEEFEKEFTPTLGMAEVGAPTSKRVGVKSFVIMRKHFKAYASGFDGAAELRAKLMETKNLEEVKKIINEL